MCESARSTHELNKREMFDGMRAYHQSELSHKSDALGLLSRILALSAAVFGVLIGIATSPDVPASAVVFVSVIAAAAICFATYLVVVAVNKKIYEDHVTYWAYGNEYVRECEWLGLTKEEKVGEEVIVIKQIDPAHPPGSGEGYKHTQNIISKTGWAVVAFVGIGVVVTVLVASTLGR